jgi:hypothetical protein
VLNFRTAPFPGLEAGEFPIALTATMCAKILESSTRLYGLAVKVVRGIEHFY